MISYITVLILFAYATVDFCEGFCENGAITKLACPFGNLLRGVETTSELFSTDAKPLCTEMPQIIDIDYRTTSYFYKTDGPSGDHHFIVPKASCSQEDAAITSISICFENGDIIRTSADCVPLISSSYSDMYHVRGEPNGPVLKCKEGSVLNSIKYDRDHEDNLIAVARCIQQDRPPALENCTVGSQTDRSFRVSCHEDGISASVLGFQQSYQMEVSGHHLFLSPYNISSESPDFLVRDLTPLTTYTLQIYAINARGRSPPLRIEASTLSSRIVFCNEGEEVEIDCPDGYLLTGVRTKSKIFSKDAIAICSQTADKTVEDFMTSRVRFYNKPNPLVRADCDGSEPVVLKFSMCFVNGNIMKTKTHCLRIQDDVSVMFRYNIEGPTNRSNLECPQGSFFGGFRMERDGTGSDDDSNVRIRGKCTIIEE